MGGHLSDEQRSRLADRSRRRSLWLLLGMTAMLVAFGLFVPLAVAGADGRTLDIRALVLVPAPLAIPLLAGRILYLRSRPDPPLLMGVDQHTQSRVIRAVRGGRAPDPYIEDLATDVASRQVRQRWLPVTAGMASLLALVTAVFGPPTIRIFSVVTLVGMAAVGLSWWINRRRARRFLVNRSSSGT